MTVPMDGIRQDRWQLQFLPKTPRRLVTVVTGILLLGLIVWLVAHTYRIRSMSNVIQDLKSSGVNIDEIDTAPGWLVGSPIDFKYRRLFKKITRVSTSTPLAIEEDLRGLGSLEGLIHLELTWSDISDQGFYRMGRLPQLQSLLLEQTSVSSLDWMDSKDLSSLKILHLTSTHINDESLVHLARLKNLETLWLDGTGITDRGLESLCKLTKLKSLGLSETRITDEGFKHLANLPSLEFLNLINLRINGSGLRYLQNPSRLTEINLKQSDVNDDGLKKLNRFTSLREMNLAGTMITNSGLQNLTGLIHLETLIVRDTTVNIQGLSSLADLDQIKRIGIDQTESISEADLDILRLFPALKELRIDGLKVDEKLLISLRKIRTLTHFSFQPKQTDPHNESLSYHKSWVGRPIVEIIPAEVRD